MYIIHAVTEGGRETLCDIHKPSSGVHFMTSEISTSLDSDSKADSSDLFIFLIELSVPQLYMHMYIHMCMWMFVRVYTCN